PCMSPARPACSRRRSSRSTSSTMEPASTSAISRAVGERALEGRALGLMGSFAQDIDVDARPATAWSEDALRIFREIQEPAGICWTLRLLAQERFKAGDIDGAASRAIEALDLATRSGMLHAVAQSRGVLAGVAASRGEHADADRLLEEVAAAFEQMGDRWQLALTPYAQG